MEPEGSLPHRGIKCALNLTVENIIIPRTHIKPHYYYYYYYYLLAILLTPGGSSTHLHTSSTQNTEDGTHITFTKKKIGSKLGSADLVPSLRVIPWHLPYN
jgi:hypothetical protein